MNKFISSKSAKIAAGLVGVLAGVAMIATTVSAATFSTNLKLGSKGADVKNLQILLNSDPATQVAVSGAGSKGMETTTFGPATKAAVIKFQNKYASDTLTPAGLTAGTGFVGQLTRSKLNTMGGSVVTTTPSTTTSTVPGCTSTAGFSPTTGASCASGVVTSAVTGPISVSLANSNPAAGAVVTGQAGAGLLDLAFSGNGTITGVKLMRTGISSNDTLTNVYLYKGNVRVSDGVSVDSNSVINFNNLNIPVAGSLTLSVKADIKFANTAGQIVGVQLTGYTTSGSTTMTTASISGNYMNVASATLATASFAAGTTIGSFDPGTDIKVWESVVTVGTRDVSLTRLALRQIGSINSSDVNNFKLFADGVEIAKSASLDTDGYVTFGGFSKTLLSGTRTLKVTADVVGGSGRTIQMSLRGAYDASFTDSQFAVSLPSTAAVSFPVGSASATVNAGTMTIAKATDSQSNNVTLGASDVSLGKFTVTSYGERIKVETLRVGMITATSSGAVTIRNVRVMVNGGQVGSTTDVPAEQTFAAASGTSFTTNFYVTPGTPAVVEVRGDMVDNEGVDSIANGHITAIQAVLVGGATTANAIPQVSLGTINAPSQTNVTANNLTISSGTMALTLQSNYGAQTVVVPATAYKLASFNLSGNATEDVNINTIAVNFTVVTGTTFASSSLSDVYLVYGGTTSAVKGTVASTGTSWSPSFTLAKNQTIPVSVYATLASGITATHSIKAQMTVTGVTANSSQTINTATMFDGQVITANTGSITATVDASRPNATLLDDNGVVTSGIFKFAAVNDSYTITDVTVTLADASAVSEVRLMDGTTVLATKPAGTTVTFSGLTVPVTANANKLISVNLLMGTVGVGAGTTGASVLTTLTSHTTRSSGGTIATTAVTLAGQAMYAHASVPTIAVSALPTSALAAGTNTLAKFTIGTGGTGAIGWNRFILSLTKTSAPVLATTSVTLWNADTNTQVAGTATLRATDNANACLATLLACRLQFVPTLEEQVSGSKTYILKGEVTGTLATNDYISTSIAAPSVFAAATSTTVVAAAGSFAETYAGYGTAASFIWSDLSAASHATTTADWNNDFLVKNLPTDSQTITK